MSQIPFALKPKFSDAFNVTQWVNQTQMGILAKMKKGDIIK